MVHNMNKNTYLFDTFLAVPMRLQVLYPNNLLIEKKIITVKQHQSLP